MKRGFIVIIALFSALMAWAQPNAFFDEKGLRRIETQELSETSGNLVSVFHRSDDVVWSRVVYRIIDMRYLQNYQLYMPISGTNPENCSLLKVMLSAIADGMAVYEKDPNGDVKPYFNDEMKSEGEAALDWFDLIQLSDPDLSEEDRADVRVMKYDSIAGKLYLDENRFEQFAKNQLKYIIQEVVFFDKHYSRLYSKILAIAPMHADNMPENLIAEGEKTSEEVMTALWSQILFWVPFDSFRPYMAKQYVTQMDNNTKRVTFDEFFQQKLYSSYLVGVSDVYDRMIPDYATTHEEIVKEQERIEWELLTAEQDLWEY